MRVCGSREFCTPRVYSRGTEVRAPLVTRTGACGISYKLPFITRATSASAAVIRTASSAFAAATCCSCCKLRTAFLMSAAIPSFAAAVQAALCVAASDTARSAFMSLRTTSRTFEEMFSAAESRASSWIPGSSGLQETGCECCRKQVPRQLSGLAGEKSFQGSP